MAYSIRSLLLCITALAFLLTTPTYARSFLNTNETLRNNEALSQHAYRFIMQSDCNLVLYENKKQIWATNTTGKGNNCYVILKENGDLIIYNQIRGIQIYIWSSGSVGRYGKYILLLQFDTGVAIYSLPDYYGIWKIKTCNISTTDDVICMPQNSMNMK